MPLIMRTSIWVPAKVDFVACFPSNRLFFRRNRRISRSILRVNATRSLTQPQQRQKRESKQNKNSERTVHFLAGFPCCHCTTYVVKRDWNGNAIFALIWKIVATDFVWNTHTIFHLFWPLLLLLNVRAVMYANAFSGNRTEYDGEKKISAGPLLETLTSCM